MRRYLVVFAVAALAVAALAPSATAGDPQGLTARPGALSHDSYYTSAKSQSGRLAQSDQQLISRTDSKIVSVMVKLDVDAVASYRGGVANLRPTSPSTTGQTLKSSDVAVKAYTAYVASQAQAVRKAALKSIPSIKFGQVFTVVYGGFEARLPANQAKNLLKLSGVAAVQADTIEHPLVDYSAHFIGADAVWPGLGGSVHAGQGTILGDIDTGIWPEHPMLADDGIPYPGGGPYACDFGLSGEVGDNAFTCNDKMLGAYALLQTNLLATGPGLSGEFCPDVDHCSARDADGHGTHTSTTAAGDLVSSAVTLGVERGPVSGVAPGASVIEYRVCDTDGCFTSDSVAAVQQAILDGVDVINFSISGGANAYTDAVELAFLDAYAAGIEVNASAGNSGPDASTSDHAGPWTNTIGASTWDKAFSSTLHLTADGGASLNVPGVTLTDGISTPTPVVLASDEPYSDALCINPADPDTFTGDIVVCERGTNARIEKGYNVLQGGAAGFILYNTAVTDLESDSHFLPAIHVNDPTSSIAAFASGHTGVMATWAPGTLAPALGDEMASFSSRGPVGDFIKPDVTAPGVQILAGDSPDHLFDPAAGLGPNGEYYQAIAGTSMSSPHASGTALLIKAAHPSWTPGQIKSAEMTSAVHDVVKEDGTTPADPFDDGAGAIRANRAVTPTVTFDVSPIDYYASSSDPLHRIDLNLPSINDASLQGAVTTTRTATNVTNRPQTLVIHTKGAGISVSRHKMTIPAGQSRSFSVTIDASKLSDGQHFGSITLNPRRAGFRNATLPVAFNKQPSSAVTFDNECDTTSLSVGNSASCEVSATNLSNQDAHVSLQVNAWQNRVTKITNYSPARKLGNGFTYTTTLSPAIAPAIESLDSPSDQSFLEIGNGADSHVAGYPVTASDESIDNWFVDSFNYGDETYDEIGVVSNGYIVVGGGTSSDVLYIPQDIPDPNAPNNVLAPYWTDLNPTFGGSVWINEIYDGTNVWIIVEFQDVAVYTSMEPRTFEVRIDTNLGPGGEHIAYTYQTVGAGEPSGLVVGAENRDGTSAVELAAPDVGTVPDLGGYVVVAGSPTPGGTAAVDYEVLGKHPGRSMVTALMQSDQTLGTAKLLTQFHVHH